MAFSIELEGLLTDEQTSSRQIVCMLTDRRDDNPHLEQPIVRASLLVLAACVAGMGESAAGNVLNIIIATTFLLFAIALPHLHVLHSQWHVLLRAFIMLISCAAAPILCAGCANDAGRAVMLFADFTSSRVTLLRIVALSVSGALFAIKPLSDRRLERSAVVAFTAFSSFIAAVIVLSAAPEHAGLRTVVVAGISSAVPFPVAYTLIQWYAPYNLSWRATMISAPSPPTSPPFPDGSEAHKKLFDATLIALVAPNWQAACATLDEALQAACDADAASCYKARCKELHILSRVHGALAPERVFDKLKASTIGMEGAVPKSLTVALHGFIEGRLKFGVVQHLVEGSFALQEPEVPALLDRYHWRLDGQRAHFERCISELVRALASLRAEVPQVEAKPHSSILEVEGQLARVTDRFNSRLARAFDKHWQSCVGENGLPSSAMGQAIRTKLASLAGAAVSECVARKSLSLDPFPLGNEDADSPPPSFEALLEELKLEDIERDAGVSKDAGGPSNRNTIDDK